MKHRYVIPAVIAMSFATAGFAYAQTPAGAPGTNNTSPGTTGSPGAATTATPATPATPGNTGLGTAATTPGTGTPSTGDNKDANNNAVNTAPQNNPGAPVPGANSFTEGQARSRIQDQGFSQVTDLKLDDQGVWRGKAMRDGKSVDVAMDYQGNVVAK